MQTKMIKRFQQGGSTNIAIGSPKPYTTNLPGINIPSGSFNNAPVEINTTSIFDQMEKMQRLKLDQDKLKFQYEELKYKEGRDFLDLAGDMIKTFGTVKNNVSGLGGLSSMERYAPVIKNYNDKKSEAMQEFYNQLKYRDPNALMNAHRKIVEVETDRSYLDAMKEIGLFETAIDYKMKKPSITNGKMLLDILAFASNPDADFAQFAPSIMDELADDTTNKDIQSIQDAYLKNLFERTKGTKTAVGQPRALPSGLTEENFAYYILTPEQIEEELFGIYKSSPSMKNFLESQGVNPENDIDIRNYLKPFANSYHQMLNNSFKPTTDYQGTILKDIEINPDGSVTSIPEGEGGGKGMSESEKKQQSRKDRIVKDFGLSPLKDATVKNLMIDGGADWYEKVTSYLKSKGYDVPSGGSGESPELKKLDISSLKDLGVPIDPTRTKIVENNGNRFLVTNQESVINRVDNNWENSTKVLEDVYDPKVRELLNLKDPGFFNYDSEDPTVWNTTPQSGNTTVYKIEDIPNKDGGVSLGGMKDINKDIVKNMNSNRIIRNMDPADKVYVAHFLQSEDIQDMFFDEVLVPEYEQTISKITSDYPDKVKNFTDNQLAYIVHHQGMDGAEYVIKNNDSFKTSNGKFKTLKVKKSSNLNSAEELRKGLDRIPDGDLREAIVKIESSDNPYVVTTVDSSSAAGKYQVLVKSRLPQVKAIVEKYLGLIDEEPSEVAQTSTPQDSTTSVQPTGKFFKAAQDSTRTNPNFNVGQ